MSEQNGASVVTNDDHQLRAMELRAYESVIASRAALASALGKAFGGDRDYYQTLGWNPAPTINDYYFKFKRQDIARRIVEAYPTETWRLHPMVWEDGTKANTDKVREPNAPFEKEWEALERKFRLFHRFYRTDVLACLGRFSVMMLGFNDVSSVQGWGQQVRRGSVLKDVSLYSESYVKIAEFDQEISSPRFGMPLLYEIDFNRGNEQDRNTKLNKISIGTQPVHWERIIHVAQNALEDDIYGTPVLEPAYNLLDDLYKVVGGGAESYWENAKRSLIAQAQADRNFYEGDIAALEEKMRGFVHNLQSVLAVDGVDFTNLPTHIASPRDAFDVIIDLIAGTTRIPQRILLGSERGELSSSQDATTWAEQNQKRQTDFAEPIIIRQFIDRMISTLVLPTPKLGVDAYTIEWQPLLTPSELDKANLGKAKAETISSITGGQPTAYFAMEELRVEILGWDAESPYEEPEVTDARESKDDDDFADDGEEDTGDVEEDEEVEDAEDDEN